MRVAPQGMEGLLVVAVALEAIGLHEAQVHKSELAEDAQQDS